MGYSTMFHVIDVDSDGKKGGIDSWEYENGNGWVQNYNKNFPQYIGFGVDVDLEVIIGKILAIFEGGVETVIYKTILEKIPELKYLLPVKLIALGEALKGKHHIISEPEWPLVPSNIFKIKE
jgi:hypothetical protein